MHRRASAKGTQVRARSIPEVPPQTPAPCMPAGRMADANSEPGKAANVAALHPTPVTAAVGRVQLRAASGLAAPASLSPLVLRRSSCAGEPCTARRTVSLGSDPPGVARGDPPRHGCNASWAWVEQLLADWVLVLVSMRVSCIIVLHCERHYCITQGTVSNYGLGRADKMCSVCSVCLFVAKHGGPGSSETDEPWLANGP